MVKDPETKEKLENMQRGDVYFYFTSIERQGKRRLHKLWLDLAEVDKELIPEFVQRIIGEFKFGERHPFEVAYIIKQLRENNFVREVDLLEILASPKLSKNPTIVRALLKDIENNKIEDIDELIGEFENKRIDKERWVKEVYTILL
jgi:hypothetical protein